MTHPPQPLDALESGNYFAKRRKIYSRSVTGRYRRLKWMVMAVTLAIYYLAPLLRWDRGDHAPDQAILIDLNHARAYWFFIEIWPQEVYYLTAILVFAAISLFFVTSLFGRVWCGYFCPQTVWTDLFVHVEYLIQGDRGARKRLDDGPWTAEKIWKKLTTHFIWLLIALVTGGAFVFYFNDAPTLWHQILTGNVSPMVLMFVGGLTFSTYLMAGFAREQVCIYMCPYSRFQSAMFDADTLIIAYDPARGEPRGKAKGGDDRRFGDCIDCSACVQVCPMGIDIRNGLQIDCIACGLCVDACNDIMDKVSKPKGLIRYDSERNMDMKGTQAHLQARFFRPRTFYYATLLILVAGVVLYQLVTRAPFELHVLQDRNPLFVQLSDGRVRNGYELHLLNKTHDAQRFRVTVEGIEDAEIQYADSTAATEGITVAPDAVTKLHLFVKARPADHNQSTIRFVFNNMEDKNKISAESQFVHGGQR